MTDPTSAFARRIDAFLAEFFRLHPLHATAAGMHAHDADWPDLTEAGRTERLAFAERWQAELAGFADEDLTRDERVDRDLLLSELDGIRFAETDLRQEAWDPLEWVYLLGGGIFPLLAREFAPLADRLASAAGRLEGIRGVVEAARTELVGLPGRPVSAFHTETALKQLPGIAELADDAVAAPARPRPRPTRRSRPSCPASRPRQRMPRRPWRTSRPTCARSSCRGPRARAGWATRCSRRRCATPSRTPELTPARILARAEQEYDAVRAEMIRLARDLWPTWGAGREAPADDGALVRAVLDAIAAEHPPAADLLDWCREELGRIEAFCRERDLVGLADDPLEIRWTPVFLRAFGGAMLDTPGPLDKGQKAFFAITPVPDDWTPEQAESYLREDNDRMLRVLTIHEAVPGHYLQGSYANRNPSIVRGIFWSGVYAEGWAVYVTQVMMDVGYGADDPALLLVHWKFYLRAAINAIIDVRIHAGEAHGGPMTEDEAVRLMVEGGFQEEAEARNKYNRARLSSTQLSTYFVGSMAMWELEVAVRRRLAEAAGGADAAAAVVERALPGGLGETPGFVYRRHLEAVMSHGAAPVRCSVVSSSTRIDRDRGRWRCRPLAVGQRLRGVHRSLESIGCPPVHRLARAPGGPRLAGRRLRDGRPHGDRPRGRPAQIGRRRRPIERVHRARTIPDPRPSSSIHARRRPATSARGRDCRHRRLGPGPQLRPGSGPSRRGDAARNPDRWDRRSLRLGPRRRDAAHPAVLGRGHRRGPGGRRPR